MRFRKSLITALTGALTLLVAIPVVAQEDDSPSGGVLKLTNETAAVTAGTSSWITLNWTAQAGEATSFRVTAKAQDGVEVGYPSNTGDHTSLYWDDILSDGEIDYTALYVTVPAEAGDVVKVTLEVSYDWAGSTRTETTGIAIPVVEYDGDPIQSLTSDLGEVEAGSESWLDLWYTAPGPTVEDVTLTVEGDGMGVAYPAMADHTGLASDADLDSGEKDVARFRLDAAEAAPGAHTLAVTVSFQVAGERQILTHDVGIEVLGNTDDEPDEESDPVSSTEVLGTDSEFYWWNDSSTGGTGAWRADVTFRNDWIRHQYLALEVIRTHADGSTTTQRVNNFYVSAESRSTYQAWNNSLTVDGDTRTGVVEVEVRVVGIRTSDEGWQTVSFDVDGPVVAVEAPRAR